MITERRRSPRMRTLLNGSVSFNKNGSTLDCVVRNLSDDGALLLLSDSVALPHAFQLDIPNRRHACVARVRWRDGERIGIAFGDASGESAEIVPLDLARRLKHCEETNARLQRRIRQLTEAG